ncbi:hypothetical protein GGS20DRAFT_308166 [Poronia punctata]|nr:hypothetical protein GGS20DRAFT_308166 [Poronia punctata]
MRCFRPCSLTPSLCSCVLTMQEREGIRNPFPHWCVWLLLSPLPLSCVLTTHAREGIRNPFPHWCVWLLLSLSLLLLVFQPRKHTSDESIRNPFPHWCVCLSLSLSLFLLVSQPRKHTRVFTRHSIGVWLLLSPPTLSLFVCPNRTLPREYSHAIPSLCVPLSPSPSLSLSVFNAYTRDTAAENTNDCVYPSLPLYVCIAYPRTEHSRPTDTYTHLTVCLSLSLSLLFPTVFRVQHPYTIIPTPGTTRTTLAEPIPR